MRPVELRMDITNACNLRCIMCHLPYEQQKPHLVTAPEFKRITKGILDKTSILYLSWATEPLLNPHLPEILQEIKKAAIPCVTMVTNLTMLPDNLADAIHLIHRLHVSIDSADPEVYAAIRQRDCLGEVIAHVRKIQELKKVRRKKYPHIAINAVVLRMNIDTIKPLIDLTVSLGVNELNLSYVSVPERYQVETLQQKLNGLPPDFNLKNQVITPNDPGARSALREAIRYAGSKGVLVTIAGRFMILGQGTLHQTASRISYVVRKGVRFPPLALWQLALAYIGSLSLMRKAYCTFPFRQLVLTADGLVLPCCVWDDNEKMGDIRQATLQEIWRGEAYARLRKRMLDGDIPPRCRACTRVHSKKRHGI
ncbi:MAG: radical SAM protein [Chitinispirillaceae bacterium]|nr:radical SAM protein [Chitinispirillaceae bacterium]